MIDQTQRDKFEQAARDLGCDESEKRWDAALKRIASQKPSPDPEPSDE